MALGKLYGIGLGPGDPELLTLKAEAAIKRADVICAPVSKTGERSRALEIVRHLVEDKEVITPHFPMLKDPEVLRPYWEKAAEEIYVRISQGKRVAFVTIGDPGFYSTFSSVRKVVKEKYSQVEIETIPGIASPMACFAGLNLPIVDRGEKLAVIPAEYGIEGLSELRKIFSTIVLMKVSRSFEKIADKLTELGLKKDAILVSKCGTDGFFSSSMDKLPDKRVDFPSMIIIKDKRK
ncbi:MAG: precorrin-2 C(20)-methyltransferase [Candidatus Hydrothermarchaeaceae archaeon]